ncbi:MULTISPECIES: hypothetical protein [Pseudomonas syringae group]|uniref:hypothetical protein n=1 Tax=Pseudomonas syringae group TaxID=136849 RepID=UPI00128F2EF4|nr:MULTISPECIES: hypothetical protein [Pseudomonas syringae group]
MIRIDSIWLATEPMDMRAGTETALARVIAVFGAAQPHCAYLFANRLLWQNPGHDFFAQSRPNVPRPTARFGSAVAVASRHHGQENHS